MQVRGAILTHSNKPEQIADYSRLSMSELSVYNRVDRSDKLIGENMTRHSVEEQSIIDRVKAELARSDPVLIECKYARFLSISKGRGRKRREPVVVELIGYAGSSRAIIDDWCRGLDEIAQEVPMVKNASSLLARLRAQ